MTILGDIKDVFTTNCPTRKFPPNSTDSYWKRCGGYNDWVVHPNFCQRKVNNSGQGSQYCNGIGGQGEWKLRTPAHIQNKNAWIQGGGNSVTSLQTVIPQTGLIYEVIKQEGEQLYDSQIENMLGLSFNNLVTASDNKDMGPLFGPVETGIESDAMPLWQNWLNTYSDNEFPKCNYNSWRDNGVQGSPGCCYSGYASCGIVDGMNVTCLRDQFAANEEEMGSISCCFNDLVCEEGAENADALFAPAGEDGIVTAWANNDKCYRSGTSQDFRTCKPESRNLSSDFCRKTITPYCTGDKLFPGQSNWADAWDITSTINVNEGDIYEGQSNPVNVTGPCAKLLMRQLSGSYACNVPFSQYQLTAGQVSIDGMLWGKQMMSQLFENYVQDYGSPLGGVNQDGIDAALGVNNFIFNMCQKFPALCVDFLTTMCDGITEERLAANPLANKWCGCYMPEEQYEKYNQSASFLLSKQCTPFCSQADTIPLVDSNYEALRCQQNICAINDVYLQYAKAIGATNFNDICTNCGRNNTSEMFNGAASSSNSSSFSSTTTATGGNFSNLSSDVSNSANFFNLKSDTNAALDTLGKVAQTTVNDLSTSTTTNSTYSSLSTNNSYSATTYSQVAQSCQCKLDGINLELLNDEFSDINFTTNCNATQCTNSAGEDIACSGTTGFDQVLDNVDKDVKNLVDLKDSSIYKKIFFLSLIALFITIVYYLFFGDKKKEFIDSNGNRFSLSKNQTVTVNKGFLKIQ